MLLILLRPVTKIYLSFNHFNKFWLSVFIMEEHSDREVILYTLSSFFQSPTCPLMIKCIFQQYAEFTYHLNAALFASSHGYIA